MNMDSRDSLDEPERRGLEAQEIRRCKACGAIFSATEENEFCPVCMLRRALAGGVESSESFSEDAASSSPKGAAQRLEHYEFVTDKDGQPIELGRGAMGVTYKAIDVDLRCEVTLKVIREKYLGDEAARLRFLREARAAASVRHPECCLGLSPWAERARTTSMRWSLSRARRSKAFSSARAARDKNGTGNYEAGRGRFGCGAQAEAGSSGHQTEQYHGELRGGRLGDSEDHRSWIGQGGRPTRLSDNDFNQRGLCGNPGVCQSGTIWGRRGRYPLRSLLAGCALWEMLTGKSLFEARRWVMSSTSPCCLTA